MRTLRYSLLLIGVLLVELFLCVQLTLLVPVNLAKEPFRRKERNEATLTYFTDKSPEKEKVFRQEMRLADRYVLRRELTQAGALFMVCLLIDALIIWRNRNEKATA